MFFEVNEACQIFLVVNLAVGMWLWDMWLCSLGFNGAYLMWDVGGEGDEVEYVLMGRDEGMEEEAYPKEDKSNRD